MSTTMNAQRLELTTSQSLALAGVLAGIRPDWDTSAHRLVSLGGREGFPHADDFAHVIRAAVWFATATRDGEPAYAGLAFFPHAGPWWTATR